jgi:hypothetical protein
MTKPEDRDALVEALSQGDIIVSPMGEGLGWRPVGREGAWSEFPSILPTTTAWDGELVERLNDAWLRGMSDARRIAVESSNFGHVEGNKRAFKIVADIEYRMNAAGATSDETIVALTSRVKELEEALTTTRQLVAECALSGFTDHDAVLRLYGNNAAITFALNPSPTEQEIQSRIPDVGQDSKGGGE